VKHLADIVLAYPFYKSRFDRSPFRFPPLGIGYIASFLKQHDFDVDIIDGTFRSETEVVKLIESRKPRIVGIYAMYSMEEQAISLAKRIRNVADLLVVGGPLPTVDPSLFLDSFDIVALGEAENAMLEIVKNFLNSGNIDGGTGTISNSSNGSSHLVHAVPVTDLDSIPFPARELFDNDAYKDYCSSHFGQTITSMISSRGCPFTCDFCSRPVFGDTFRSRSPRGIVDEMEAVSILGYDAIWFADDCFTISKDRVLRICDEIDRRDLDVKWQCLSRVDTLDKELASRMRNAGCQRIYFGIESGDETILNIMQKQVNLQTARNAVSNANSAGIETGAFFIIGYPGDNERTVLNTLRFATSLPLNYVSFTLPYPIPGTGLYEKVKHSIRNPPKGKFRLIDQHLTFGSEFSEFKLKFAIVKAAIQFRIRRYLGEKGYRLVGKPFEKITDNMFKMIR
jgi:anaerobic magnesium-protoporphyrin IX monomethyl ester cyclase